MEKILLKKIWVDAFLIFLMVLIAFCFFSSTRDANINSRLSLVKAYVDENRFEIDSYHNTELYTVDKAYFNGHYYSDKAIGASVIGIGAYYVIRRVFYQLNIRLTPKLFREWVTYFAISLPSALIVFPLYFVNVKISNDRLRSFLVTLAICLGTPLFKYSTAFYGHSLAAVFCFSAFSIWFHFKLKGQVSLPLVFLSAILLGFAFITEYPVGLIIFVLGCYIPFILFQLKTLLNWKIYALILIGFLIPTSWQLLYNHQVFGSIFSFGYSHEATAEFQTAMANAMGFGLPNLLVFWYQTFHPSLGIMWQSPILLASIVGWVFMAKNKDYRAEFFFSIFVIIAYLLLFSGYYMWWGGVALTPRHIIPILPFFTLPLMFFPKKLSPLFLILLFISIFQNLVLTASGYLGLYEFFERLISGNFILVYTKPLVYEISLPNLLAGDLMNNRGIDLLKLSGLISLLPLLVVEAALFVYIKMRVQRA